MVVELLILIFFSISFSGFLSDLIIINLKNIIKPINFI